MKVNLKLKIFFLFLLVSSLIFVSSIQAPITLDRTKYVKLISNTPVCKECSQTYRLTRITGMSNTEMSFFNVSVKIKGETFLGFEQSNEKVISNFTKDGKPNLLNFNMYYNSTKNISIPTYINCTEPFEINKTSEEKILLCLGKEKIITEPIWIKITPNDLKTKLQGMNENENIDILFTGTLPKDGNVDIVVSFAGFSYDEYATWAYGEGEIPFQDILHYDNRTPKYNLVATANSQYSAGYAPSYAINGLLYPSRWETAATGHPTWIVVNWTASMGYVVVNATMMAKDSAGSIWYTWNISYWDSTTTSWVLVTPNAALGGSWTNPVANNLTDYTKNITFGFNPVNTTALKYTSITGDNIYGGMSELWIGNGTIPTVPTIPILNMTWKNPITNDNHTKNTFKLYQFNISCNLANCGDVNVTLDPI